MKKHPKIPKFKSEAAERAFWKKFNLADHFNRNDFEAVAFPNLKPTSRPVSIRIPNFLLVRIKEEANELHVPYQSLIKRYIARGVMERQ